MIQVVFSYTLYKVNEIFRDFVYPQILRRYKMKKNSKTLAGLKIMPTFATHFRNKCPDGGIGRRAGLKHQWIHFHAGSIPALGTKKP